MEIDIKIPTGLIVKVKNGKRGILFGKDCTIAASYFETVKQLCMVCIDCLYKEVIP